MTVSVAEPVLPAASLAVAVQTLCVSAVTAAAVNVLVATLNEPPFVQLTFGPTVIPTASVADKVEVAVASDSTVNEFGLKDNAGATVSTTGGGGVGVLPPPPPPQADRSSADAIDSVERCVDFK